MAIKIDHAFVITACIILKGCAISHKKTSQQLLGKWAAVTSWADLEIQFTKTEMRYHEHMGNVDFICNYTIIDDTILLLKKDTVEKHVVSKIDDSILSFEAWDVNQKDVPYLDALVFKRMTKQ